MGKGEEEIRGGQKKEGKKRNASRGVKAGSQYMKRIATRRIKSHRDKLRVL